jgi:hypothetical protein
MNHIVKSSLLYVACVIVICSFISLMWNCGETSSEVRAWNSGFATILAMAGLFFTAAHVTAEWFSQPDHVHTDESE